MLLFNKKFCRRSGIGAIGKIRTEKISSDLLGYE